MSSPRIRGLTLHRPWPAAIVHAGKRIENRSWKPAPDLLDVGDFLALHAGMKWDEDGAALLRDLVPDLEPLSLDEDEWPTGWKRRCVIVGVARIAGFKRWEEIKDQGDPYCFGPWCWMLDQVRECHPLPHRGAQGLWTLDPNVEIHVREFCKPA